METDYRIYMTKKRDHWGPIFWDFLYLTAMGFPVTLTEEQRREFKSLIQSFHVFIPCPECRLHYKENIKNIQINLKTKTEAMDLVLYLHNSVRKRQGKRTFDMDDIISYHYSRSRGTHKIYFLSAILIVIVIMYYKRSLAPR